MLETILFYVFAAVTVGGAFAVAFSASLRQAAIMLVLAFGGVSGLFFVLKAELLAAMELLVFVGGVVVLLLMGACITSAAKVLNGGRRGLALAVLAGVVVGIPVIVLLARTPWQVQPAMARGPDAQQLGQALVAAHGPDAYLVPLLLLSVTLLTVIMGAAYLARWRRPLAPQGPPHIETLAPSPMVPRRKGATR